MSRSVPKSKRAAYVYDRDFIVVDDISGVLKMRSQCAVDGYGFLSANGDPRNPQEIPPDIRDDMAAWPDARPIGPANFVPEPAYVYFIVQYTVVSTQSFPGYGTTDFSAGNTVCFNAPLAGCDWYVDGALAASGINVTLTMTGGITHSIRMVVTDTQGHTGELTFNYDQPYIPHVPLTFAGITAVSGEVTLSNGNRTATVHGTPTSLAQLVGTESYNHGKWFFAYQVSGSSQTVQSAGLGDTVPPTVAIFTQANAIDVSPSFAGAFVDGASSGSIPLTGLMNTQQFIMFFDADAKTWGIITPDNVSHDMSSLTYGPEAIHFVVSISQGGSEFCDMTILLNSEITLTPPVGYSNAAEP